MALPTDTGDPFIREVDESYRRERLENFAKRYGGWIVAGLVLFLAAVGGWIYWQNQQRQASAEQSEELSRVFADIGEGRLQTVPERLDRLSGARSEVVRASAMLTKAAVALERNDRAAAIAIYREVAADEGMTQAYRDVATLRATALEFDTLEPAGIISRLEPMAQPGQPWFGTAGELTALAHLKAGRQQEAGRLFAAIAEDPQVPPTIRSRVVQMARTLGVEPSANTSQQESQ